MATATEPQCASVEKDKCTVTDRANHDAHDTEAALIKLRAQHIDAVNLAARARAQAEIVRHELNGMRAKCAHLRTLVAVNAAKIQASSDAHAKLSAQLTTLRLEKSSIILARDESLDTINMLTSELQAVKRELELAHYEMENRRPPNISKSVSDTIAESTAAAVESRVLRLLRKIALHYAHFHLPPLIDFTELQSEIEDRSLATRKDACSSAIEEGRECDYIASNGTTSINGESLLHASDEESGSNQLDKSQQNLEIGKRLTQNDLEISLNQKFQGFRSSSREILSAFNTLSLNADQLKIELEQKEEQCDSGYGMNTHPENEEKLISFDPAASDPVSIPLADVVDEARQSVVVPEPDNNPISASCDTNNQVILARNVKSKQLSVEENKNADSDFTSQSQNAFVSQSSTIVLAEKTSSSSANESVKSTTDTQHEEPKVVVQSCDLPIDGPTPEPVQTPTYSTIPQPSFVKTTSKSGSFRRSQRRRIG